MAIETVVDKSSSSAEKTTDVVNSSHPYYLTPSDSPGNNLINIIFDGSNCGNWKRGVLISLSAKNKFCFVDDKAILQERYGQIDGAKLFQLQRDLNNISQGTNDVASYFNKLKKLWDQMKVLNTFMTCGCDCKCGAKTHNHKMNEDIN
ncbi:hypothetical protein R3W88_000531 [Solanum pinnatisectum]|uniref:Retrotransposon Copia-like N-terminal domain-containing protein n=1 Tax=Solanum pinnatisectum TaxID=50273 RepID=A0AAV9MIJ0_9SOLN|nr:hypothetical protein R3W88_000531 [Solanum pinnatisectum]